MIYIRLRRIFFSVPMIVCDHWVPAAEPGLLMNLIPHLRGADFHFLSFSKTGNEGNRDGLRENEGQTIPSVLCCCVHGVLIPVTDSPLSFVATSIYFYSYN